MNEKKQISDFAKAVSDLNIISYHRLIHFGLKLLLLP